MRQDRDLSRQWTVTRRAQDMPRPAFSLPSRKWKEGCNSGRIDFGPPGGRQGHSRPGSSRRSESRLMDPERGLERGRRGVSFRQFPSGASAYRVRKSGDTKVWLRHVLICPRFDARPGRCVATSGMLLSYVDFFSGLSSETPEKTRMSGRHRGHGVFAKKRRSDDEVRNYSSTKGARGGSREDCQSPKNGSKLSDAMSGAYRQLLGSPPAGGLGRLHFRFPPTGIGVVFLHGRAERFGFAT
jgi:hypothetical protein